MYIMYSDVLQPHDLVVQVIEVSNFYETLKVLYSVRRSIFVVNTSSVLDSFLQEIDRFLISIDHILKRDVVMLYYETVVDEKISFKIGLFGKWEKLLHNFQLDSNISDYLWYVSMSTIFEPFYFTGKEMQLYSLSKNQYVTIFSKEELEEMKTLDEFVEKLIRRLTLLLSVQDGVII